MNTIQMIFVILLVVIALAALVWLLYVEKLPIVRKLALQVVVQMEAKYGSGTGLLKYAEVVTLLYPLLPKIVRTFITQQLLDDLIEEAVIIMKKSLGEKKIQDQASKFLPQMILSEIGDSG